MSKRTLKILYIGKYPPYVGGETTKAYWLLRALAERGHKIFIVTDAWELPSYWSAKLTIKDLDFLQPSGIKVFSTTFHNMPSFIPPYNPKTEKLVSMGIEFIESFGEPDIIFSWYLVPFSSAAHILQQKYKIPHVIHHAGSDVHRLLFSTFLQDYLIEVIRSANGVITYPSSKELMEELNQNTLVHSYPLNSEPYYNTEQSRDIKNLYNIISAYSIDEEWRGTNMARIESCISENKVLVVIPGKWEKPKGIYSWLELADKVDETCLILVGNGAPPTYNVIINKIRKLENIIWIGFIPLWRMPEIYRAVDAVGHLEIRFPVPNHSSLLALESLLAKKKFLSNTELSPRFCNVSRIELDEKDIIKMNSFANALLLTQKSDNCNININDHRTKWNNWVEALEGFFYRTLK